VQERTPARTMILLIQQLELQSPGSQGQSCLDDWRADHALVCSRPARATSIHWHAAGQREPLASCILSEEQAQ
jgi:hypothetical protein